MWNNEGTLRSYSARPGSNDILWRDWPVKYTFMPDGQCMYVGSDHWAQSARLTTLETLAESEGIQQNVFVMDCTDEVHTTVLDRLKAFVLTEQARRLQLEQDKWDAASELLTTPVKIVKQ
ncbi:hypothetical protein VPHK469_0167 [Vibrio phage K469]